MTLRYLGARLLGAALGIFFLSLAVFALVRLIPGSVEDAYFGTEGASEQVRAAFRARYGLDESLVVQYLTYLRNLLAGDLGYSIRVQQPVTEALLEKLPPSFQLAVSAVVIAIIASTVLGTVAALREGRFADRTISLHTLLGVSVPDFLMGMLLIAAVATSVSAIPVFGYAPLSAGLYEWGRHMLLPAFTLSFVLVGYLTRLVRASALETLRSDHVRTARGKGMANTPFLLHHVVRPSLIPIVTTTGVLFVGALGGVVVVEQVFAIPGIGRLVLDAIRWRDFALVQGATLAIGTFAIVVNLLVDLSYRFIDPRLKG
jgi:peptide/nickel transport system permease protein